MERHLLYLTDLPCNATHRQKILQKKKIQTYLLFRPDSPIRLINALAMQHIHDPRSCCHFLLPNSRKYRKVYYTL